MCNIIGNDGIYLKTTNGITLTLSNGIWTDLQNPTYDDIIAQLDEDVKVPPLAIVSYTLRNLGIAKNKFNLKEIDIVNNWYKECLSQC